MLRRATIAALNALPAAAQQDPWPQEFQGMIHAATLLTILASPAASKTPAVVQPVLDYHAQACQAQGGALVLGEDAVVKVRFRDDSGAPAYVLDTRRLACPTAPAMFCNEDIGCELVLSVGTARHGLIILDWALVPKDDQQLLQTTIAGELLNQPEAQTFLATWDSATQSLLIRD